jgi:hypothetical protein
VNPKTFYLTTRTMGAVRDKYDPKTGQMAREGMQYGRDYTVTGGVWTDAQGNTQFVSAQQLAEARAQENKARTSNAAFAKEARRVAFDQDTVGGMSTIAGGYAATVRTPMSIASQADLNRTTAVQDRRELGPTPMSRLNYQPTLKEQLLTQSQKYERTEIANIEGWDKQFGNKGQTLRQLSDLFMGKNAFIENREERITGIKQRRAAERARIEKTPESELEKELKRIEAYQKKQEEPLAQLRGAGMFIAPFLLMGVEAAPAKALPKFRLTGTGMEAGAEGVLRLIDKPIGKLAKVEATESGALLLKEAYKPSLRERIFGRPTLPAKELISGMPKSMLEAGEYSRVTNVPKAPHIRVEPVEVMRVSIAENLAARTIRASITEPKTTVRMKIPKNLEQVEAGAVGLGREVNQISDRFAIGKTGVVDRTRMQARFTVESESRPSIAKSSASTKAEGLKGFELWMNQERLKFFRRGGTTEFYRIGYAAKKTFSDVTHAVLGEKAKAMPRERISSFRGTSASATRETLAFPLKEAVGLPRMGAADHAALMPGVFSEELRVSSRGARTTRAFNDIIERGGATRYNLRLKEVVSYGRDLSTPRSRGRSLLYASEREFARQLAPPSFAPESFGLRGRTTKNFMRVLNPENLERVARVPEIRAYLEVGRAKFTDVRTIEGIKAAKLAGARQRALSMVHETLGKPGTARKASKPFPKAEQLPALEERRLGRQEPDIDIGASHEPHLDAARIAERKQSAKSAQYQKQLYDKPLSTEWAGKVLVRRLVRPPAPGSEPLLYPETATRGRASPYTSGKYGDIRGITPNYSFSKEFDAIISRNMDKQERALKQDFTMLQGLTARRAEAALLKPGVRASFQEGERATEGTSERLIDKASQRLGQLESFIDIPGKVDFPRVHEPPREVPPRIPPEEIPNPWRIPPGWPGSRGGGGGGGGGEPGLAGIPDERRRRRKSFIEAEADLLSQELSYANYGKATTKKSRARTREFEIIGATFFPTEELRGSFRRR